MSVPIVLFVQPDSLQPCLIGMNAAPALGLSFLNAKGQPLKKSVIAGHAQVNLALSKAIPACAHFIVQGEIESDLMKGSCVLFEPDPRC